MLIHGAWHGAWTWERFSPLLVERGLDFVAVDLPSAGDGGDLAADVAVVRATLDELHASGKPVTVVAHAYGGAVATEAVAGRSDIGHLLYVAAFQLDVGESLLAVLQGQLPPWVVLDEATGALTVPDPVAAFYADVDSETAAWAAGRLRPQAVKSFTDTVTAAAWQELPCTYVACTEDKALPYPAQEAMAARSGTVVTMRSSHSPVFSHPDELADLIAAVAASL